MVWKQDLAKLKQELKQAGPVAPEPVPKKPSAPAPPVSRDIADEDACFLEAMGRQPSKPPRAKLPAKAQEDTDVTVEHREPDVDFQQEMQALNGLKPIHAPFVDLTRPPSEPALPPVAPKAPTRALLPRNVMPPPVLMQLAAGMAIEVDAVLDLRGHNVVDARERLLERVQDGVFLGWRTLHVIFGPQEAMRTDFLELVQTSAMSPVTRYAQAPVPMGGEQAWILYFPSR